MAAHRFGAGVATGVSGAAGMAVAPELGKNVAEDEAAFRARGQTIMVVPQRLVPAIVRLITRENTVVLRKRPNKGLQPARLGRTGNQ